MCSAFPFLALFLIPLKLAFEVTEENFEAYNQDYIKKNTPKAKKGEPAIVVELKAPAGYITLQSLIGKEKIYGTLLQ